VGSVKVVCAARDAQSGHAPAAEFNSKGLKAYPECPRRYDVIHAALAAAPWASLSQSTAHVDDQLAAVHEDDYLTFLRTAYAAWAAAGGEGDLAASVFSGAHGRAPASASAATGFYGFDTTPIVAGTWAATRAASDAALTAADLVLGGDPVAYALCRPPGHHASHNRFGGYCYLNHAALAAQRLSTAGTVAIVDIDYHHGNGTQQIFYARDDVLFVSLHADPEWEYPLFWGRADETGTGRGLGFSLNVPLPPGIADADYLQQLRGAVQLVRAFDPCHVVISAGFDIWHDDPLGTFRLSAAGICQVGAMLADLALPTVIVQEGGYDVAALGGLVRGFLQPFCR
jgi:acetoin utilization deacetylase AcuC-like enzyme